MAVLGKYQVIFLLAIVGSSCSASPLEIQTFQPAVVPIRAVTTLTIKTNSVLNMTSNSSLQCRFKDISVPARMQDGFIFCDTPPMRNVDRVSVHLDVGGQLYKTKTPLYFHEPFKVSNISPSVVSPAQSIHLTISGISCKDWIRYFVRFQTANGTKKTQQGICRDSIVSCYVPEFPPSTRLRVGLTLSNRLVEWVSKKILIQYPIDAIKSTVEDVRTDTTRKGTFTFLVVLRDRFKNPLRAIEDENRKYARISVQYSSRENLGSMKFLECPMTRKINSAEDAYLLSCTGAEKEKIYFYPSINNVPLGGQEKYEATTTLCPGRNSCVAAEPKAFPFSLVLGCGGAALLLLLFAVIFLVRRACRRARYLVKRKQQEVQAVSSELEMEVSLPSHEIIEDLTRAREGELENPALEAREAIHIEECGTVQAQDDDQKKERRLEHEMRGKEKKRPEEIEMSSMKEEVDGKSTCTASLPSLVGRLINLTSVEQGGTESDDDEVNLRSQAQEQTMTVIDEIDAKLQEIEKRRKQQGGEVGAQKAREIVIALRKAYGAPSSTGNFNVLPLIEELQESISSFEE